MLKYIISLLLVDGKDMIPVRVPTKHVKNVIIEQKPIIESMISPYPVKRLGLKEFDNIVRNFSSATKPKTYEEPESDVTNFRKQNSTLGVNTYMYLPIEIHRTNFL